MTVDNEFEVEDPRGLVVVCTKVSWSAHIEVHHPIMSGQQADVTAAIADPDFGIYRDAQFEDRYIYYRRSSHKFARYTKVVVRETPDGLRVVTAFYTDSMKSGESLIWPRSKRS